MPKIITRGTKTEQTFRGICKQCGSDIEFRESELTTLRHDRDGAMSEETCPVCKTRMCVYPHS